MRQITQKLDEDGVERYACLTEYEEGWPYPVAFPPERPDVTLATVISGRGETQLHVAETEKYPHVTYFFNGGEEDPYEGEVRELVDSPRDVATYDEKPEMSAREAADAFVEHWKDDAPVFGIINFANPDMVGHTGVIPAAVKAVETVDECLGRVVEAVHAHAAAPASSPPTTATATRCSRRTAPRTRRTRSTRCPSSSRWRARSSTARGSSPTWRPRRSPCWGSSSPKR